MKAPGWLSLALSLLLGCEALLGTPIIRDPGAMYLSDFGHNPLKLKLMRPAMCYFDIDMTRYAGTLRFPQIVQVEALADYGCRIRGNAQQGGVAAWVPYNELEPLPEGLLDNLKKSEERRKMVDALIAKNEVAIGMTIDEVGRSLGRPQKVTNRADQTGTAQIWEFIKYSYVPQTTYVPNSNPYVSGAYVPTTVYVKVPVGTLRVNFKDGLVESLDQSEGTLVGAGQVSVVTPPINVYW